MPTILTAYDGEQKVVDTLSQKFGIKKTDLYKFLIHRKFGSDIIRKVYGKKTEGGNITFERPGYITLLMDLMDAEHLQYED